MSEPVFTLQAGYKGFARWLFAVERLKTMPVFDHNPNAMSIITVLVLRDSAGGCFPSIQTLAKDTALCETSVKKALKDLRHAGLVQVLPSHREDGRQCTNRYKLLFPWEVAEGEESSHGPRGARGDGGRSRHTAPEYTRENLVRERGSLTHNDGGNGPTVFGDKDMSYLAITTNK